MVPRWSEEAGGGGQRRGSWRARGRGEAGDVWLPVPRVRVRRGRGLGFQFGSRVVLAGLLLSWPHAAAEPCIRGRAVRFGPLRWKAWHSPNRAGRLGRMVRGGIAADSRGTRRPNGRLRLNGGELVARAAGRITEVGGPLWCWWGLGFSASAPSRGTVEGSVCAVFPLSAGPPRL